MRIVLDFETKSRVDLKKRGADVYCSDPTTDILCMSVVDIDSADSWLWYAGTPFPSGMWSVLNEAIEVYAQNARFDQMIYEYIGIPDYKLPNIEQQRWRCSAAQCRVNALPSSLDGAGRAANAKHKKDHAGMALIRKLSIPDKKTGEFNRDPKLMQQMGRYCLKDSLATKALINSLRPLSNSDKRDWLVNERINDRGVLIDTELAALAEKYAAAEKEEIAVKLTRLTNGVITKHTQTKRALEYLKDEFADRPPLMRAIVRGKPVSGEPVKYTLDKAARGLLLESTRLDSYEREVLELIDEGGKSSVAKFTRMLNMADPETGRVHGAFIFAGAGQTQRYTSKGLQLHNMARDCWSAEIAEAIKFEMKLGRGIEAPVMTTLAKLLRPALIPAAGKKFVVGDWAAIEGRVLPWLANSAGAEKTLDIFRADRDIYVETAAAMNLKDRQVGKVATLSLGFGGALGAFSAMAKAYGLELDDNAILAVVGKWREANPWAVKFWSQLERAARAAVRSPATVTTAGRIRYVFVKEILGGTLMCILPDNTVIQYPYARIEKTGEVSAMKASVQPRADSEDEWPRMRLWGGFLAENVTQATAAALLRELLARLDERDWPIVGHVHDEVISEEPKAMAVHHAQRLKEEMERVPDWAEGLPLKAEPVIMDRYGK